MKEKAEQHVIDLWRECRNGMLYGEVNLIHYLYGAIDAFATIGLFSAVERDGWKARIKNCPGHDDEGGRSWCAYCGDMPSKWDDCDDVECGIRKE